MHILAILSLSFLSLVAAIIKKYFFKYFISLNSSNSFSIIFIFFNSFISFIIFLEITVIEALYSKSLFIFLKATFPPPITRQFLFSIFKKTGKNILNPF